MTVLLNILALVLGYLLGSIPTARLVARLKTGSAESLGGGNVGTLNTIRSLGLWAGVFVFTGDVSKGALAVFLAYYLLKADTAFVLGAGLSAVIGHNWMVWLRFRGGRGMAAAVGAVLTASLIYGYGWVFLVFAGIVIVIGLIIRNVVPGNAAALLALPFIVYWATRSALAVWMASAMVAVIVIKFAPAAVPDIKRRLKALRTR